jgi:hypothetical protein
VETKAPPILSRPSQDRSAPSGVDGWLIVALLVLATRIANSLLFFESHLERVGPISFANPIYALSSLVRIADPIVLDLVAPALLLTLAAFRSWLFPSLYIAFVLLGVASAGAQAGLTHLVVGEPQFNQQLFFAVFSSAEGNAWLLFSIISIPYMLLSRRVRNTFRRHPARSSIPDFPGDNKK